MTKLLLAALVGTLGARLCSAQEVSSSSVTLRRCYDWALAQSEDLRRRQEDIVQADASARAAMGGLFPKASYDFTDTYQDPKGVDTLNSQGFGGFIQKEQPESKFTLRQPLFSGLREFSAFSGFRQQSLRDSYRFQRASRELYLATAGSFYSVVGQEVEWANTNAGLELARSRIKELQGFKRLGKARDSEVFTAQAHAAALQAQLKQIEARIGSARAELSFLTGKDLARAPLADELPDRPAFATLEESLAAGQERSDVRAQKADLAANELKVRYEKGGYWPSIDVSGHYYTRRATYLSAIHWDAMLSLDVPIFEGGTTRANVRRALSAYRQSELALSELARRVAYLVGRTHGELLAAAAEAQSQEEAAAAAQKSYDSLLEEYRLGLVTNLDVLQALDLLQTQRNARDAARLNVKRLFIELGVATERLP
ncbi:MAG TPA: TolC family protein [Elusimicrobiota bacterium]|nr:TolC family protein [Elusimicrobiota bacterium]